MFFEDAKICSKELEIARQKEYGNDKGTMCGVLSYVESYLVAHNLWLLRQSEQVEDPKTAKGIVKRCHQNCRPGTNLTTQVLDETRTII